MFQRISTKLDKIGIAWVVVLMLMVILFILSFRGIFSALTDANKVDESLLDTSIPRLNKADLDKAFEIANNKEMSVLDLKD